MKLCLNEVEATVLCMIDTPFIVKKNTKKKIKLKSVRSKYRKSGYQVISEFNTNSKTKYLGFYLGFYTLKTKKTKKEQIQVQWSKLCSFFEKMFFIQEQLLFRVLVLKM
jgi:penicillin-binding protein-related factor A (putative recombinase)